MKARHLLAAVLLAAPAAQAQLDEVCDASIAVGTWSVEAPHLGTACIVNLMAYTGSDKGIAALSCPNFASGTGVYTTDWAPNGEYCRTILTLHSTKSSPEDFRPEQYEHYTVGGVRDLDPKAPTSMLNACELAGPLRDTRELLEVWVHPGPTGGPMTYSNDENGLGLMATWICGWKYQGDVYPSSKQATKTCKTSAWTTVSTEECNGLGEPPEWIYKPITIQAVIPMEPGTLVAEDEVASIQRGPIEDWYHERVTIERINIEQQ